MVYMSKVAFSLRQLGRPNDGRNDVLVVLILTPWRTLLLHTKKSEESKTMKPEKCLVMAPDSENPYAVSLGSLDQFAIVPDLLDPFVEEPEFVDPYTISPDLLDQFTIILDSLDPIAEALEFIDDLEVVANLLDDDEVEEEENAPKKKKKMSDDGDGLSPYAVEKINDEVEGSLKIAPKVRVRDFDLNKLPDAKLDGDIDKEAEMKRFIESLFRIFILSLFY